MATLAESQAREAWAILTALARRGGDATMTYSDLAERLGTHEIGLAPMLDLIMTHCRAGGLPPLTGLVVLKETGVPSDGFPLELTPAIPRIYTFDWESVQNPFT